MRVNLIYSVFTFVFILVACSNKERVETEYFPTGEIKVKRIFANRRDTNTYLETTFFLNGERRTRGNYVNGLREGIWQGGHPDGELSWNVEYENGIVKPPAENPNWWVSAVGVPDFRVGEPIKLRVYIEGVEPKYQGIMLSNAKFQEPSEENDFWFVIIPQRAGNMILDIGFLSKELSAKYDRNAYVVLGSDTIYVLPAEE